MTNTICTKEIGTSYENLALDYLKSSGLSTIQRNFLCKLGEIDLIMLDSNTLVFIEVRYRKNTTFGNAIDSITTQKQKKIIRTAKVFLSQNTPYQSFNCRFDVLGIDLNKMGKLTFDWIKNAFME